MLFTVLLIAFSPVMAPKYTEAEEQRFLKSQVTFILSELEQFAPAKGNIRDAIMDIWRNLIELAFRTRTKLTIYVGITV